MRLRELLGIIILIMMIPLFFNLIIFSSNIGNTSPEQTTEDISEIMVAAATPWWLGIVETLSQWGTFGAFIIIGLFWILSKNPDLA